MKTFNAHFDGKYVVLDEPSTLKPNTKVTVIVAENDDLDLTHNCARLSEPVFEKIWGNPLDADYDKL